MEDIEFKQKVSKWLDAEGLLKYDRFGIKEYNFFISKNPNRAIKLTHISVVNKELRLFYLSALSTVAVS